MELKIKVLRRDKRDALGERIEKSLGQIEKRCRKINYDSSADKVEAYIYDSYANCDLFPGNFPVLKERDGDVPAFVNYSKRLPRIIVAKDILKEHFPADNRCILGVMGHEMGHALNKEVVLFFEKPSSWKKIFNATAEEGSSMSAGDTYMSLEAICSDGSAEDFISQVGLANCATRVRAYQMQELAKQDQLSRYGFIGKLYFPLACRILAEHYAPAKKLAEDFWSLAEKSADVKTCIHDLNFYKHFIDTAVSEKLYRKPAELLDYTLRQIKDKKHFY